MAAKNSNAAKCNQKHDDFVDDFEVAEFHSTLDVLLIKINRS